MTRPARRTGPDRAAMMMACLFWHLAAPIPTTSATGMSDFPFDWHPICEIAIGLARPVVPATSLEAEAERVSLRFDEWLVVRDSNTVVGILAEARATGQRGIPDRANFCDKLVDLLFSDSNMVVVAHVTIMEDGRVYAAGSKYSVTNGLLDGTRRIVDHGLNQPLLRLLSTTLSAKRPTVSKALGDLANEADPEPQARHARLPPTPTMRIDSILAGVRDPPLGEHDIIDHATANAFVDACLTNDVAAVRNLVDSGMPVNGRMFGGQTPLQIASQDGSIELLNLLLTRGADATTMTPYGMDLVDLAVQSGDLEKVGFLVGVLTRIPDVRRRTDPQILRAVDAMVEDAGISDRRRKLAIEVYAARMMRKEPHVLARLLMAAAEGFSEAQYVVGCEYWNGASRRIERDFVEAEKWLNKARAGGYEPAEEAYTEMLRAAAFSPKARAAEMLESLAVKGNVDAQYLLGLWFRASVTPPDFTQALRWFRRAAEGGHPDGAGAVRTIEKHVETHRTTLDARNTSAAPE